MDITLFAGSDFPALAKISARNLSHCSARVSASTSRTCHLGAASGLNPSCRCPTGIFPVMKFGVVHGCSSIFIGKRLC